ncbi:hypothetical protein [uncultured Pseudacidovorax sp.]|nr:hypothetical protein [uncultured Pseudacidovorax sp.]
MKPYAVRVVDAQRVSHRYIAIAPSAAAAENAAWARFGECHLVAVRSL